MTERFNQLTHAYGNRQKIFWDVWKTVENEINFNWAVISWNGKNCNKSGDLTRSDRCSTNKLVVNKWILYHHTVRDIFLKDFGMKKLHKRNLEKFRSLQMIFAMKKIISVQWVVTKHFKIVSVKDFQQYFQCYIAEIEEGSRCFTKKKSLDKVLETKWWKGSLYQVLFDLFV